MTTQIGYDGMISREVLKLGVPQKSSPTGLFCNLYVVLKGIERI